MLYSLNWLKPGNNFPPLKEQDRITRYRQNAQLFDGDHFADSRFRIHDGHKCETVNLYAECAKRIERVVGNFEDVISFPVLLNYQRLMSLKMADLVCGEYPTISGATSSENNALKDIRDYSDFDAKMYSTVLDISRYGDAIWRIYKDESGKYTFTCWDPTQWYPIVKQDGTNTIIKHCLAWRENRSLDIDQPDWYLNVQIHSTQEKEAGYYEQREYKMDASGAVILDQVSSKKVPTGLKSCAILHLKAFTTTNSVYGYDDYMPIDSILSEIMVRVGQISGILDKHADPNITGPVTMLETNAETGEYYLKTGKFYAVSPGEEQPKYMTWDGQLSSAFSQLEFLINQLYILSEMGAALLGSSDGSGQAISGAAMRFKMVNPLAKARRISNSLTRPVRMLFSAMSIGVQEEDLTLPIPYSKISVFWADGLPDDPRENIENAKLATGATKLMPLEKAIMEYFGRSNEEALKWIEDIRAETEENMVLQQEAAMAASNDAKEKDPNHAGPQDGTGVNTQKKGSETGLNNFESPSNKKPEKEKEGEK